MGSFKCEVIGKIKIGLQLTLVARDFRALARSLQGIHGNIFTKAFKLSIYLKIEPVNCNKLRLDALLVIVHFALYLGFDHVRYVERLRETAL